MFVGLIVTNCIVLGRAESFAMHHPPLASLLDGIGNGLGYALILVAFATVRELLGAGTLLAHRLAVTARRRLVYATGPYAAASERASSCSAYGVGGAYPATGAGRAGARPADNEARP